MGKGVSKLLESKKHFRLLMIGLDSAGKTTILYKLKLGEYVQTIPTIELTTGLGCNIESIKYKNISFECWDTAGLEKFRKLWAQYSKTTHGIIFVLDASDKDRIVDAREELGNLLKEEEMKDIVLLVYANKQDVPGAIPASKISKKLGLDEFEHIKYHIQESIANTGAGIFEGIDWLIENLSVDKLESEKAKPSHLEKNDSKESADKKKKQE